MAELKLKEDADVIVFVLLKYKITVSEQNELEILKRLRTTTQVHQASKLKI